MEAESVQPRPGGTHTPYHEIQAVEWYGRHVSPLFITRSSGASPPGISAGYQHSAATFPFVALACMGPVTSQHIQHGRTGGGLSPLGRLLVGHCPPPLPRPGLSSFQYQEPPPPVVSSRGTAAVGGGGKRGGEGRRGGA